jgi:hypothetical protein
VFSYEDAHKCACYPTSADVRLLLCAGIAVCFLGTLDVAANGFVSVASSCPVPQCCVHPSPHVCRLNLHSLDGDLGRGPKICSVLAA